MNKKAMYIYTEDDNRTFETQLASREAYANGYKAGYKAGCAENQNKSLWIPVTERLPDDPRERVLIYTTLGIPSGTPSIDTDRYAKGDWVRYGDCVTHWMPLPEPPKEESYD